VLAVRVAETVFETDLSLLFYRELERYRAGATFARYLLADVELHLELLVRDDRPPPLTLPPPATLPNPAGASADALIGSRFSETESGFEFTFEYLYYGSGLDPAGFSRLVSAAEAGLGMLDPTALLAAARPLRRHYLLVQLRRATFDSEWSLGLTMRLGLEDGGTVVFPNVEYRLADGVTVGAGVFVFAAKSDSEVGLSPFQWNAFGRLTAFY
jgi:hypothetical protein